MNRLATRLTLTILLVTLISTTLMSVAQLRGIERQLRILPLELREELSDPIRMGRLLLSFGPADLESWPAGVRRASEVRSRSDLARVLAEVGRTRAHLEALLDEVEREERRLLGRVEQTFVSVDSATLMTVANRGSLRASMPAYEVEQLPMSSSEFNTFVRGSLVDRARSLALSAIASLALAVILALLLAKQIARPIERVSRAAVSVAEGDLPRLPVRQWGLTEPSESALLAHTFNRMAESVEKLERGRKAMMADIAHELRTPLTIMRGRLEALEDGLIEPTREEVQVLHQQALLLSRLVEDLHTLSLADTGRLSLKRREVDAGQLIRTVLSGFEEKARAKQVTLTLFEPPGGDEVSIDPERIAQVLVNLLDNAIRHTPHGGQVQVGLKRRQASIEIEVADTGPGLPHDSGERVFERFFRTDASRSRAAGGSGLGLTIVKTIVSLHGGRVEAGNLPTGGARFRVVLPVGGA